jgi:hypothetical protein
MGFQAGRTRWEGMGGRWGWGWVCAEGCAGMGRMGRMGWSTRMGWSWGFLREGFPAWWFDDDRKV